MKKKAITSVANSEGVLLITPFGTSDSLTTEMDYVFRTCFKDSFQGELAAKYASNNGYDKVEIVAEESVATMTEVDYTNQLNKMAAAGADLSVYNDFMFVNHYATELATSEVSSHFVETYTEKYGEAPNNFDALGYDVVLVYKDAIEKCGSFEANDVQATLADTSTVYEISSGTFSFDETGIPIKSGVLMAYSFDETSKSVVKSAVEVLSVD